MKKFFTAVIKQHCRFLLKLASGLFLLFFAGVAPAAPVAAQTGSAVFLFLVLLLTPFLSQNSTVESTGLPDEPSPIYCQLDNDAPVQEQIIFQRSQRQIFASAAPPAAEKTAVANLPELCKFTAGIIEYLEKKPQKTYCQCQPVRAGPVFIIA